MQNVVFLVPRLRVWARHENRIIILIRHRFGSVEDKQLLHPIFHFLVNPVVLKLRGHIPVGIGFDVNERREAPNSVFSDNVRIVVFVHLEENNLLFVLCIVLVFHEFDELVPLRLEPVTIWTIFHEDIQDNVLVVVSWIILRHSQFFEVVGTGDVDTFWVIPPRKRQHLRGN